VHRIRRHESALFWLSLAGVVGLMGFGLITYERTGLSERADPWHHFWFVLGVAGIALSLSFCLWACFLFARQRWIEMRTPHDVTPAREVQGPLLREIVREYGSDSEPISRDAG
jgi:hypothetical protein